jgi:transposase
VAAWLLRSPDELSPEQQRYLAALTERWPGLEAVHRLAVDFAHIIRTQAATELEPWLVAAETSALSELREFAGGMRRDEAARQATLDYAWSSGQVEGQINRLKLIKRSMYGRAGFELLRLRVLRAA